MLQLWGTKDLKQVLTEQVSACKRPRAATWQQDIVRLLQVLWHLQLCGDVGVSGTPVEGNSPWVAEALCLIQYAQLLSRLR